MSLPVCTSPCVPTDPDEVLAVTLARGSVLKVRMQTFSSLDGAYLTIPAVLFDDSTGGFKVFVRNWVNAFLSGESNFVAQLKATYNIPARQVLTLSHLGGVSDIGAISISPPLPHRWLHCSFHPRLDGKVWGEPLNMGGSELGKVVKMEVEVAEPEE